MVDEEENSTKIAPKNIREMLFARFDGARAELAKLDNSDLAELLCDELDRRRLDEKGNPTDATGLYMAAATAISALLAPDETSEADQLVAKKLAYVARGGKIQTKDQETVNHIVEVHQLVTAVIESNLPDKAESLAKTLSKMVNREIKGDDVAMALGKYSGTRLTTEIAFICEFFGSVEQWLQDGWRTPNRRVSDAIKQAKTNAP